jgi:hypothetical protein
VSRRDNSLAVIVVSPSVAAFEATSREAKEPSLTSFLLIVVIASFARIDNAEEIEHFNGQDLDARVPFLAAKPVPPAAE